MILQSDHIALRALEPLDIAVLFDWEMMFATGL